MVIAIQSVDFVIRLTGLFFNHAMNSVACIPIQPLIEQSDRIDLTAQPSRAIPAAYIPVNRRGQETPRNYNLELFSRMVLRWIRGLQLSPGRSRPPNLLEHMNQCIQPVGYPVFSTPDDLPRNRQIRVPYEAQAILVRTNSMISLAYCIA